MTTPMMQQYEDAKSAHPGMLLLFRMGDFFETFGDDAELASRVLGLTLTSRDKAIPMAGFPHHQLESYLRKLLHQGHRVAVCDQVEDAALAKGLVKRDVTRVVTPGTVTEDELLDPRAPNHLAAVYDGPGVVGLAWVDLSSGTFLAVDLPADRIGDELARLAPAECLAAEAAVERWNAKWAVILPRPFVGRPDWTFDPATALAAVKQHLGVLTLNGFGFEDHQPCVVAAGALVVYLQETLKAKLSHLQRIQHYRPSRVLQLDEVTRRSLELTRTLRDSDRNGSLLSVIDRTQTLM